MKPEASVKFDWFQWTDAEPFREILQVGRPVQAAPQKVRQRSDAGANECQRIEDKHSGSEVVVGRFSDAPQTGLHFPALDLQVRGSGVSRHIDGLAVNHDNAAER